MRSNRSRAPSNVGSAQSCSVSSAMIPSRETGSRSSPRRVPSERAQAEICEVRRQHRVAPGPMVMQASSTAQPPAPVSQPTHPLSSVRPRRRILLRGPLASGRPSLSLRRMTPGSSAFVQLTHREGSASGCTIIRRRNPSSRSPPGQGRQAHRRLDPERPKFAMPETPDAPTPAQQAQVRRCARRASVLLEDRYRGDEIGSELAMEFPVGFAETERSEHPSSCPRPSQRDLLASDGGILPGRAGQTPAMSPPDIRFSAAERWPMRR